MRWPRQKSAIVAGDEEIGGGPGLADHLQLLQGPLAFGAARRGAGPVFGAPGSPGRCRRRGTAPPGGRRRRPPARPGARCWPGPGGRLPPSGAGWPRPGSRPSRAASAFRVSGRGRCWKTARATAYFRASPVQRRAWAQTRGTPHSGAPLAQPLAALPFQAQVKIFPADLFLQPAQELAVGPRAAGKPPARRARPAGRAGSGRRPGRDSRPATAGKAAGEPFSGRQDLGAQHRLQAALRPASFLNLSQPVRAMGSQSGRYGSPAFCMISASAAASTAPAPLGEDGIDA